MIETRLQDHIEMLVEKYGSVRSAARIAELEDSVRFFAIRCEELQEIQSRMRDPERQMVCDILANGKPRDKAGIGEYKALAALLQE